MTIWTAAWDRRFGQRDESDDWRDSPYGLAVGREALLLLEERRRWSAGLATTGEAKERRARTLLAEAEGRVLDRLEEAV